MQAGRLRRPCAVRLLGRFPSRRPNSSLPSVSAQDGLRVPGRGRRWVSPPVPAAGAPAHGPPPPPRDAPRATCTWRSGCRHPHGGAASLGAERIFKLKLNTHVKVHALEQRGCPRNP